ncbi:LysR family transcriptional regulator (plasmid) [Agrobacterium rosae]|uniref:HTH-type transcriptional regulator TtuA n=2 Tax=Agrobacterium rosae TaxID=1972867 RepID=A0AAW9FRI6_9HYPH|nr:MULTISPECIES: LysR family transcriptional regulator [Agrobacterium]MDX8321391.1 LysR family transcriptional regulator [Agrobacterium sp. rho-8.1]MDX8305109.1 LysR family transcriptional regulator [Agrobacterium rosae]MDX8310931.1 LysR family transcriptional regulator [Agrobacterium sp. rho-13.3]MDX8316138.1 LysR family transcriptional regulator [Agrobacterium rosae]MDX8327199.1 LysR family transcriptional regulator [Agrobacterium tumefaciens]
MARESIDDLQAFVAVAREQSFTRAAVKIGVSPSAISQTITALEARIGVRLLTRTTRNVSVTEAGDRLLNEIGPRLDGILAALTSMNELREKPAGTVRLTSDEHAAESIIWPVLERFLPEYPDIKVEVTIDYGLSDIVGERYDAGVRLGETVAKDMIALPIGPKTRMIVVGAPSYIAGRQKPKVPQELTNHRCINFRLPTLGGLYAWEFEKSGRTINVRVDGQVTFNGLGIILKAVLSGAGLAYLPEEEVHPHIDSGALVPLLQDWTPLYPGYHIYYPSRRQHTPAFSLLLHALRYRETK